jgi:predicted P-loop ATPase
MNLNLSQIAAALGGRINGRQVEAPGPGHSANDRSMSVLLDSNAPDGFIVNSFSGDDPIVCKDYVRGKLGLPPFKPNGSNGKHHQTATAKPRLVATYRYTDASGVLLYEVQRLEPKTFRQRRANGEWKLGDVQRVLYRLPEIMEYPDATVFVAEGEKDVDRLASQNHCATTISGGTKWTPAIIAPLKGRDVVVLQDNDDEGRTKALLAAHALHGVAATIRVVLLLPVKHGGDVSDWLDADPARAETFVDVCLQTRLWTPHIETEIPEENNIVVKPINIDWAQVEKIRGECKNLAALPTDINTKAALILGFKGSRIPDLNIDLASSGAVIDKPFVKWDDVAFTVAQILRADTRLTNEKIAAVLLCPLPCNRIITEEKNIAEKQDMIKRLLWRTFEQAAKKKRDDRADQAKHAADEAKRVASKGVPPWREQRVDGSPLPSMHNARLAINALGIICNRDTFHNKTLFGFRDETIKHELQSLVGEVTDDGIIALRQIMSDKFGFDLEDKATRDAVRSLALNNCFNPVCDLIDKAEADWDGIERLEKAAVTHFNCEDTPLNRAFMRKTIIAMIARARVPGIKFDTITVLESVEGYNKSTAWRVLAGDENFSDEPIIGKGSREVQEQLSEIWLHENADLAGMKKAEVETVKAFASRTTDIARAAFAHYVVKQLRHSIETGSTNSEEYLQSQTGNRRFWPLRVLKAIDIDQLKRDRLQLIGEAARCQSAGESITLDEAMWPDAAVVQEDRRVKDAWEDSLEQIPTEIEVVDYSDGNRKERSIPIRQLIDDGGSRVASLDLLTHVLGIPLGQQTTVHSMRLSVVMKRLGWERDANKISIRGKQVRGFSKPKPKESLF